MTLASGGFVYDPEVLDWVSRVVTNGGSVSQGTKDAANTFILAIRAAGIRSLLTRVNLYAGTGLDAARTPFIKDIGGSVDVLNNFVSGDYSESTGLTGDGATKYNNPGVTIGDFFNFDQNSISYGLYSRVASSAAALDMGSLNGVAPFYTYLAVKNVGTTYFSMFDNGTQATVADSVGTGFYLGVKSSNAAGGLKIFRNGSDTGASGSSTGPGAASSVLVYVHAANNSSTDGSGGGFAFSSMVCGGYHFGHKFDATQQLAYYNAWQAFQTALGRQV